MRTIIAMLLLVAAAPASAQTSTYNSTRNGQITDSSVTSPDGSGLYDRTVINPKTGNVTSQSTYIPAPKPLEGYNPMGSGGYHPMGR